MAGCVFGVATPAPVRGGARMVEGHDEALLLPPAGATIEPYENDGYRLSLAPEGRVRIEVDVAPLKSQSPFHLPPGLLAGNGIERLARAIVSGAPTRYAAVSSVLSWVSRNVRYELDRELSQEPQAVLERRSGYCTGISALTVALLEAVDLEAREVSGFVLEPSQPAGGGYHRWVEVFYPDRGWVFSDPSRTHHYVPATYLRLASEELDLRRQRSAVLLERRHNLWPVDIYPRAGEAVLARRNSTRQRAASISIVADRAISGTARLAADGTVQTLSLIDGRGAFVGLLQSEYQLSVELDDGRRYRHVLRLDQPDRRTTVHLLGGAVPKPVALPGADPLFSAGAGRR